MDKTERKLAKKAKKAARPWFKKKRFILPAVFVLIIILAANTPTSDGSKSNSASETPSASAGPVVFGGQCGKVLENLANVKSTVSAEYNEDGDLVVSVTVADNYVLNSTIGDLSDLYQNGSDKFGSQENSELFSEWFSSVMTMNQYADSSGERSSFTSDDMGPFNLIQGYYDFVRTSDLIESTCSGS